MSILRMDKTYPLLNTLTSAEDIRFGIKDTDMTSEKVGAMWTGEKRAPRKGEWFLSGARIGAYHAFNDMSMVYHIARLVRVNP